MSTVRLLFAPENTGFAEKLALALAESGYSVSNDDDPTAAALVIWSQASSASKPILSAARSALARRTLVPVALGKTPPPPSFEHLWPMDLAGWNGRADDPRWKFVLDELELATRRGVVFRPAAANDRGAAPERAAPVKTAREHEMRAPAAPAPKPATSLSQGAAEPALFAEGRADTIRPRPKFPRIAIGAGVLLAAVAGVGAAVLLIGVSDGRRAAAEKAAPPVAFVVKPRPENDAAPLAVEAPGFAVLADEVAPPADLREGETAAAPPEILQAEEVAPAPGMKAESEIPPVVASAPPAAGETAAPSPATQKIPAPPTIEKADDADPIARLAFAATSAPDTAAGRYLRDCLDCPDLAEIDAGSFLMGAVPGEAGAEDFEGPQTAVTVTRPLAMAVRETSYEDWRLCVADGDCPALAGAGARPVAATQDEAQAYAAWLSRKTGRRYRLPSEAEWEYAARGGFGLAGLFTGVREWTADCWRASHAGRPADASAIGGLCQMRVIKGDAGGRPASRDGAIAEARRSDIGFRLVRDLY